MKRNYYIVLMLLIAINFVKAQTWTTYKKADGLIDTVVNTIAIDSHNNKWFGTQSGISKFDDTVWTNYTTLTTSGGLVNDYVNTIAIDSQDNKWFGTGTPRGFSFKTGGVSMFDGVNWITYLKDTVVTSIAIDDQGNKWFGTYAYGVYKFDGTNWVSYTTKDGLISNSINSITIDADGNKWFATMNGLSKFDETNWISYTTANGLKRNSVYSVAIDTSKNVWVGYGIQYGPCSVFNGNVWSTVGNVFAQNIVNDLNGNLWFGSGYGRVFMYDGVKWTSYTTADGLAGSLNRPICVAIDTEGGKWFGTNGGVSRFNEWCSFTDQSLITCTGLTIGKHTYTTSGTYKDTLISYQGCDSVIVTHLTVLSSSSASYSQALTICSGQSVKVGSDTYTTSGTYAYTFHGNGCDSTVTTNLIVKPSPTILISGTDTICSGQTVALTASGASGYLWSPSASMANPNISNPIASPTTSTNYTVTGIAANGCTSTSTHRVTVNLTPNANISLSNTNCSGGCYKLTASGGNAYLWDSGQTTSVISVCPTNASTTYKVVASIGACSAIASTSVTIDSLNSRTNSKYTKLYDLIGQPSGDLVSDGVFLYGMTYYGGTNGQGTIFKIKPDGTEFTILLSFSGAANGRNPVGSLVFDGTFLYGMTLSGGSNDFGVIFKIKPDGSGHSKILDFTVTNGAHPDGSLVFDGTYLYGMAANGGTSNQGVIFKIKPDGTGYSILLSFTGLANGRAPLGSLISDGTFLYGMTTYGGINDSGVVFKIKPDGSGYSKLLDFTNGAKPNFNSLISDGVFLYGMTAKGGAYGYGTIFKLKLDGTGYSKLLDFAGANGMGPSGSLISDGSFLYGMTAGGGTGNCGVGTIFKIKTDGTGYSKLHDFSGLNGSQPYGSLTSDGKFLYGMTGYGGLYGTGTVFKICIPKTFTQTLTLCAGQSATVGKNTYTQSGTYIDTLIAANSCDSIITTNLTVLSSSSASYSQILTICSGQSVSVGSDIYDTSGTYTYTFHGSGCDSTVTTKLVVTPSYSINTGGEIYEGDSIILGGIYRKETGLYIDSLKTISGCDSIVHTKLNVVPLPIITAGKRCFYMLIILCYA